MSCNPKVPPSSTMTVPAVFDRVLSVVTSKQASLQLRRGSSQNMYIPVENVAINAIKCNAFMYRLSSALKSLKSCD